MATTEKLQNEILLKEEAFLKEEKAKLTEQLNKLKVRMYSHYTWVHSIFVGTVDY